MKRPFAFVVSAVAGLLVLGLWTKFGREADKSKPETGPATARPVSEAKPKPAGSAAKGPAIASDSGAAARDETSGEEPGHTSLTLKPNHADPVLREELESLQRVFLDYRALNKTNPVGNNAEITAALLGANEKGFHAEIPPGSKVNAAGELVDRWETPYFFHQLSGTAMEIRSAGPDKVHGTGDDTSVSP